MHNEMTYSNYRPGFISFYCYKEPIYRETPIVNCNNVWENLPIDYNLNYTKIQLFNRYFPSNDNPSYKNNKLIKTIDAGGLY